MFALVAKSNAWAEARYAKEESYAGYLVDLERAWQWVESESGWNVGRQIRCGLIQSSIRSLAGNVSPELLEQLVETGVWSTARALAHIPQMPDERQRAESLTRLARHLAESLKLEALQVARAISNESARANALSRLAAHLPDELKAEAVTDALAAARRIQNESSRAIALSGLAAHLPDELKAEALAAAREISPARDQVVGLYKLSFCLKHLRLKRSWMC